MASKLSKLRQGKSPYKTIQVGDMKVAVVIVSSDVIKEIEEEVEQYANDHKDKVNDQVRNQYFDQLLCYHCMRDPDDTSVNFASSVDEIGKYMDLEDISRVTSAYGQLMVDKAPKLELLTEEQFDELKKKLEETQLSDLSTVQLVHLSNFHQTIPSGE